MIDDDDFENEVNKHSYHQKESNELFQNSLHWIANEVTKTLEKNDDGSDQKKQVEGLIKLEKQFRKEILKHRVQTREIYFQFIRMIVGENRNILSARPYFREKSNVFNAHIAPAIREANIWRLSKFHFNFMFMLFVKSNWKGGFPQEVDRLYRETEKARKVLIENNMPLAINRAKLFYRKVPRSQLDLMDIIGIAAQGLINGIDKYVGKYTKVFRSVCIGRMTGDIIDNYSDTVIRFYTNDRQILYRANSLRHRYKVEDVRELTKIVNKSFAEDRSKGVKVPSDVTPEELYNIMTAASIFSLDQPYKDDSDGKEVTLGGTYFENNYNKENSPEEILILEERCDNIRKAIDSLPLINQKVLMMKGAYHAFFSKRSAYRGKI